MEDNGLAWDIAQLVLCLPLYAGSRDQSLALYKIESGSAHL